MSGPSMFVSRREEEVLPPYTGLVVTDLPPGILCNFRVTAENEAGRGEALAYKKYLLISKYASK